MKNPEPIYLKNYRPAAYVVDRIHLELDIFDEHTTVTSRLELKRHEQQLAGPVELELKGENLELLEIKRDGKVLMESEYAVSKEALFLHAVDVDSLVLEIKNRIYPDKNTALEGLYRSGDILCTQCEPEGFRKITYFTDRPDVMARYTTTLKASKARYPQLLSNGNRVKAGELPDGRHFVTWDDPHRKPSYLFAAVAGDLELAADTFTTRSGRRVALEVYVDKGQGHKTGHALRSLANAMKWDEDTFGLEYDLDIYMIVAVESFNFGAMENKGLNIFNSAYVLADALSATDDDFQGVEAVVGHEYFHNWSGNRVTCRDWFQLTLKEGLTVFRDQEFSSDMLSRAVKRIEDVKRLKEMQFAEDAGPMSHPIRPSSYIEINNFYTATVYEKGAEVIRMIHTLIGEAAFKKGITAYFQRFDGQAVTTDDFVAVMEESSGKDLRQFKNWYSRPGTPTLKIRDHYDAASKTYSVDVTQVYPSVLHERLEHNVLHVPFKLALFSAGGKTLLPETMLELKALEEHFEFPGIGERPIASWNRGFSAPVILDYAYSEADLLTLVAHDTDPVSRYEALQLVYTQILKKCVQRLHQGEALPLPLDASVIAALGNILADKKVDDAFKAHLFVLPSEGQLHQELDVALIDEVAASVQWLKEQIGTQLSAHWEALFRERRDISTSKLDAASMGARALRNRALSMLVSGAHPQALDWLKEHFYDASCMTDEATALSLFCKLQHAVETPKALAHFYAKWKHEPLVMLRWFGAQATHASVNDAPALIERLERDPAFRPRVPNDLRTLYGQFARQNLRAFHAADGSGHRLLAERILRIDAFNPQVASRLCGSFALMTKLDAQRQGHMKAALQSILAGSPSKDVFEVCSKYLGQS